MFNSLDFSCRGTVQLQVSIISKQTVTSCTNGQWIMLPQAIKSTKMYEMFTQLYIKYLYLLLGSHTSKSVNKSPTRLAADGLGPLTPLFDGTGRSMMTHLSTASLFLSEIVIALMRKCTNTTSKTCYSIVWSHAFQALDWCCDWSVQWPWRCTYTASQK